VDGRWAVADLGSNSFRLVVFEADGGAWQRTDEIYEAVRIGEGLQATGELGEAPMARGLAVLEVFSHFCEAAGIPPDRIDAVATSAIRDARNQAVFLARSPLRARVLSTEDEARYGHLAAVNSSTLADGVVLDLGGGSMQLVEVTGRRAAALQSWKLGAVRTTERFGLGDGPVKRKQLDAVREHVHRKLERAPWLAGRGGRLVAIGGTARNLAAAAQRAGGWPEFGVQGFVLERDALADLVERLAALPARQRARVDGIKPGRAEIILAGAAVIHAVLEHGGFDGAEVTEAGLREGVFFEHLLGRDRPLFDDVRRQSVLNLAARYGSHPDRSPHVAHVAKLALGLFDALAGAGLHEGDPAERELLWAASVLHDIGMTVDYDDHHKHSRYLLLSAGLPGFTPREVALVGQAVRFHRKGLTTMGPFEPLAQRGDGRRLARMAVLLRLAEDLERSRDQAVRGVRPEVDGEVVRLVLDVAPDATVQVPRWAAGREDELFGRAFGRSLAVA
jgi:exopolyphosphatase / guanosine-5'-triphosphate,3'-diphosphate pyrophosphatase